MCGLFDSRILCGEDRENPGDGCSAIGSEYFALSGIVANDRSWLTRDHCSGEKGHRDKGDSGLSQPLPTDLFATSQRANALVSQQVSMISMDWNGAAGEI